MADDGSDAERTEQPSPKRLSEAREQGNVPRSRELSTAAVVAAGAVAFLLMGGALVTRVTELFRRALQLPSELILRDAADLPGSFGYFALEGLTIVAPVLLATMVAAVGASLLLGGWNFSPQAIAPKFEKLDPVAGIGRMFSLQSLVELGKALAKFLLVAVVALYVLRSRSAELAGLGNEPVHQGLGHAMEIFASTFLWMCLSLVLVAAVDVPYQLWNYHKSLRMTREELRRELEESEGKPEVKAKIRQMQQEVAKRRMMQDVPKADVVVVNPTHYAVALQYTDGQMRAPRLVAKGADHMAQRIREVAREHRVPILSAPPLARALYRLVDIGDEIPVALYQAVAQVLTWVYQLRRHRSGPVPAPPQVQVPRELDAP